MPDVDLVQFNFDEQLIDESVRDDDDLVITLDSGDVIQLINYFENLEMASILSFAPAGPALFAPALGALAAGAVVASMPDQSDTDGTGTDTLTFNPTNGTSVSGTGEPGATLTITYGSPEQTLTTTVGPNGLWTISPTDPIPHGTVINVSQVDPAGNTGGPATGTVDGQIGVPTIDPTDGTTVTGTGEVGATVTITYGYPAQTIETTVGINGTWTISPTDPIPAGTVINATQVDPAGNISNPANETVTANIPTGFKVSGSDSVFDILMTGADVHSAGDVNGDGFDDFIVSVNPHDLRDAPSIPAGTTGSAYVILGGGNGQDIDLTNLSPSQGFKISGAAEDSGRRVTSVGDVNGDGLDDVLVSDVDNGTGGKGFVVFGQSVVGDVNLADISGGDGSIGFELFDSRANSDPNGSYNGLGYDVTGLGDVNGDGIGDFAITNNKVTSISANFYGLGNVHVVFGSTSFGSSLDLSTIDNGNAGGFRIQGQYFFPTLHAVWTFWGSKLKMRATSTATVTAIS